MAGHAAAQRGQVFLDYFDQLGTVRWLCGNAMSFNATTIARFFGCDGHHAHRARRLDPMDHLSQTTRDSHPPDQECLLDARGREATRLLLRPVWVVQ
jgi:hypothetical protein